MYTIKGKYTYALVTNDLIDPNAIDQLQTIINQPIARATQVALMPDGHYGANVPVGMTMRMLGKPNQWRISPTIISGDIGCGMLAIKLNLQNIDYDKLDHVINHMVPSGFNTNERPLDATYSYHLLAHLSFDAPKRMADDALYSLGSLGGGNHFIELDQSDDGNYWLVIHCGSRHFGTDILNHHMQLAQTQTRKAPIQNIIDHYKQINQPQQIAPAIKAYKQAHPKFNGTYAFLTEQKLVNYLNDVVVGQSFAAKNRTLIAEQIINAMDWKFDEIERFDTIHNYFDPDDHTIRKGATSAQTNKRLLIPLNMRDGSLICIGKGNPAWNFSAPHGAGRILSRKAANEQLTMEMFKADMQNIHTSSVTENTLDEAPNAYKPMNQIIDNIGDTVTITERNKPVYNYKAH